MTLKPSTVLCAICALFLISCGTDVPSEEISIVPEPLSMKVSDGGLDVRGASFRADSCLDGRTLEAIETFRVSLEDASGSACPMVSDGGKAVFDFRTDADLAPEAYRLTVDRRRATVEASSFNGFLYAIETLRQLLPSVIYTSFCQVPAPDGSSCPASDSGFASASCPATASDGQAQAPAQSWILPCVEIEDSPRFSYRGMHLDVARHFWTVPQVKKYIDMMAVHKMNTFHWHLTDDQGWRIAIKKYPKLVEVGSKRKATAIGKGWYDIEYDGIPYEGHYTQDQIREVVAYAASKGITVIPEIDLPGHMLSAIASYPELGCTGGPYEVWGRWGVSSDVLCAGRETTFRFLEDVLSEIMSLFPSEYIHIGGDECPKSKWRQCPDCQARMRAIGLDPDNPDSAVRLQGYVTRRVESFLAQHGRRIIGWDEILDGGISESATIMSWRGSTGGIAASKAGHDVIMTPNIYCYLDYYQSRRTEEEPFAIGGFVDVAKVYSYEPFTPDMTADQCGHILGVQANLWTEYISTPEHLEYMLLPRMSAVSEVQWCAPEKRDYGKFLDKLTNMMQIYRALDFNFAKHLLEVIPVVGVNVERGCPEVRLTTQGNAPMYYTLDGTQPTTSSALYEGPVCISDGDVFKAIVDRCDMETGTCTLTFSSHKAVGRKVKMNTPASPLHSAGLPGSLVNGILNEGDDAGAGEWMAWYGEPVDVVIDMGGRSFGNVSVRALVSKWEDMFPPVGLDVYGSSDGKDFALLASEDYPVEEETVPDGVKTYDVAFPEVSLPYLRVIVRTLPALPSWSERPGRPAYLFIDEIKVQ